MYASADSTRNLLLCRRRRLEAARCFINVPCSCLSWLYSIKSAEVFNFVGYRVLGKQFQFRYNILWYKLKLLRYGFNDRIH